MTICPRCGGTRQQPRPVLPQGENPWAYGPGMSFPLCMHEHHLEEAVIEPDYHDFPADFAEAVK